LAASALSFLSPAGVEIDFLTEDVEAAFRMALEAGAISVAEPKTMP